MRPCGLLSGPTRQENVSCWFSKDQLAALAGTDVLEKIPLHCCAHYAIAAAVDDKLIGMAGPQPFRAFAAEDRRRQRQRQGLGGLQTIRFRGILMYERMPRLDAGGMG